MKEIPLSQNAVALVDDSDFEELDQYRWYLNCHAGGYAARNILKSDGKRGIELMHRHIMNPEKGMEIDHLDHNPLNNQRSNLRIVTKRQNSQNRSDKKTSIYPGVSWDKNKRRWRPRIQVDGKLLSFGSYATEIGAFDAYCRKLKEIGEVLHERFMDES